MVSAIVDASLSTGSNTLSSKTTRSVSETSFTQELQTAVERYGDQAASGTPPESQASASSQIPVTSPASASNTPVLYQAPPTTFVQSSFGGIPTQVGTLQSYLQQWLQDMTVVSTVSLVAQGITGPQDFAASALRAAQGYCAAENPPDSSDMNSLVAQYAEMAQAAYANVPASQWNPATYTDYALPPAGSTYTAGPNNTLPSTLPELSPSTSSTANTPSNTPTLYQAPPPEFVQSSFGGFSTQVVTLQSYLQQWLQDMTQVSTLSLVAQGIAGPQDFAASALRAAQGYCTAENPPDSASMNALVAQYAGMAQAAYANVPASQWNPATFTDYALSPA